MAYDANTAQIQVVQQQHKQHGNKRKVAQKSKRIQYSISAGNHNDKKKSTVAKQTININTFSKRLSKVSARTSSQQCAKSIRLALESAGARFAQHPIAAADWGKTLKDIGYKQIDPAFENPEQGDIYIIQRTKAHSYGHIAGFSGAEWVSDFKQSSYAVYKENVKYSYYRLGS